MMGVAGIRKDGLGKAVDAAIDRNIAGGFTTGILVRVSCDGELVYQRCAGLADRELNSPVQENTLFRLASISKAFTSLAVAALVGQGKLSMDDPVSKWLPWFTPELPDGSRPVITIRQLLCHMSGLDYRWAQKEDGPYAKAGVSDGLDITGLTLEENLKRLACAPLCFSPGTSWLYSLGPDVLGAVVAHVQGTDFPTALAELVTEPLGMKDTAFYAGENDRKRMAAPYYLDKGKLVRMKDDQFLTSADDRYFHFSPERVFRQDEYPSGGVGLVGTASDLMRLVETIRTGQSPVVGQELMKQMSANQLKNMMARPGFGFSLGWGVLVDPVEAETPQTAGTLAWGGVYGSKWFADPARKLSVVTMTTTALDEVVSVDIRNAIYGSF